jgi:hypothetical protein
MIGVGKHGGFSEESASASGVQNHKVVIGGAANQAKPTAFDL